MDYPIINSILALASVGLVVWIHRNPDVAKAKWEDFKDAIKKFWR